MFYLQTALEDIAKFNRDYNQLRRNAVFAHLQSITTIEEFNNYYRSVEQRFMSALDDYNQVMYIFRAYDFDDEENRFNVRMDMIQAQHRIQTCQADLKEMALLFALNHHERRAGFELNPNDYEYTVDSLNVSVD